MKAFNNLIHNKIQAYLENTHPIGIVHFYQAWNYALIHLINLNKMRKDIAQRKIENRENLIELFLSGKIHPEKMREIIIKDQHEVIDAYYSTVQGQKMYSIEGEFYIGKRMPFAIGYEKLTPD